jgi:transcriptional regulator with XRE-family HTH domain
MPIASAISGQEHIGIRLRSVRRENGFTQDQLARETGTNQAVIQKIENGKSLRPRQIMRIAEVLNINPAWLQFGEPWADRSRPQPRRPGTGDGCEQTDS